MSTGSPLARMKSVVDGLITRSNGKYRSARGSSVSDARRMLPTTPTISAVHVAEADALADRISRRGRSARPAASLMITTAGPVASRASNSRPARSGIRSAPKVAGDASCQPTSGGRCPAGKRMIDPLQRRGPVVAGQRRHHGGADGVDLRQRLDAVERAGVERPPGLVCRRSGRPAARAARSARRRREAGIDGQQVREAAQRQPGAGQQHDGERDLDRHERRRRRSRAASSCCRRSRPAPSVADQADARDGAEHQRRDHDAPSENSSTPG